MGWWSPTHAVDHYIITGGTMIYHYFSSCECSGPWTTDVKIVIFWCPRAPSSVTISSPDWLSSSGTGVNPRGRNWMKHSNIWLSSMTKSHWCYLFHKEVKTEILQPLLEFDNFKPLIKCGIFNCIFWLNGPFLRGDYRGFVKDEVKICLMALLSPLKSPS